MFLLASIVAISPFSISTYLPTIPALAADLNTPVSAVNLTISAYMLGNALGQFLGGAMSDQLGRKAIILPGLALYVLCSIGISFATSIEQIQIMRVIQALGAGVASVTCIAMLRDVFDATQVSKKLANIMMIMLVAPMVAPLIGAFISQSGWRTLFYMLAAYGFVCLLCCAFFIPEIRQQDTRRFSFSTMLKNYKSALTYRVNGRMTPALFLGVIGFSGAIFTSYVTTSTSIYMDVFQMTKYEFSMVFAGSVVSLMAGNRVARLMMELAEAMVVVRWANTVMIVCLIGLCTLAYLNIPTFWPTVSLILIMISAGAVIAPTASGLYLSQYNELAGSASSLSTTVMFTCGALLGAIASTVTNGTLLGIFATMLTSALAARIVLMIIGASSAPAEKSEV